MKVQTTFKKEKDPNNPRTYITIKLSGPTPIVKELLTMIEWFFRKKEKEGWSQA